MRLKKSFQILIGFQAITSDSPNANHNVMPLTARAEMQIKYLSKSKSYPKLPETTEAPDQVFAVPSPISGLANKNSIGNCSDAFGLDIYSRESHVLTSSICLSFSGKPVGINQFVSLADETFANEKKTLRR